MTELILIRYLHFISVFALVGAVVAEQFLVSRVMTRRQIIRIAKIDALYGISAIIVLIGGLLLWFVVGKPASFYTRNWIFHTKLTLFVFLALVSIYPTIFFLKNRKGSDLETSVRVPGMVIILLRIELLILIFLPLLASYMALGIGSF